MESYSRLQADEKKDSAGAQQQRYLDFGFKDKILPSTNKNQAVLSLCLSLSFVCSFQTEFLLAEGKFCKGKLRKKLTLSSVSTQILMKIYQKFSSYYICFLRLYTDFLVVLIIYVLKYIHSQSSGVAP